MNAKVIRAAVAAWAGVAGASASAASLSGSVTTTVPSPVNLTAEGALDWAIWDYRASGSGASGAPSNRKLGGTAIGNASAINGTLRGITGTVPAPEYAYTDGTSPTSAAGGLIGAITDNVLNTAGPGVRVSITGDPTGERIAKVFVTGFNGTGTFTATLNGATTYTDSSVSYGATRFPAVYTLTYRPDSATDVLTVSYRIQSTNGGGNTNMDLQAVAVSAAPVPEPVGLGVLGVAGLVLGRRRR